MVNSSVVLTSNRCVSMPFIFGPGTGGRMKAIILKKTHNKHTVVSMGPMSLCVYHFLRMSHILITSSICFLSSSQAKNLTNPVMVRKLPLDGCINKRTVQKLLNWEGNTANALLLSSSPYTPVL